MATTTQMTTLEIELAGVLRAERRRLDLTIDEAADASGLARSVYYRLERGQRHVDVGQLEGIAGGFGTTITELLQKAGAEVERRALRAAVTTSQTPGTARRSGAIPPQHGAAQG